VSLVRKPSPGLLVWIGLFAAPTAWALQHLSGIELQYAQCHDNTAGPGYSIHVDAWTLAVTIAMAAIAVVGGISAVAGWRATKEAEDDDAPPSGRIHFLGVVGMTITPLFLAIILMSGLGEVFLPSCIQS
jgi:hypothetical protein